MVEVGPLLGKVSIHPQEIHGAVKRGLWLSALVFFFGMSIVTFILILLGREVVLNRVVSDPSGAVIVEGYLVSYLLIIVFGIVLFFPGLLAIRYSLSKSMEDRKYAPAFQDVFSWIFFLFIGGFGSQSYLVYVSSFTTAQNFGSNLTISSALFAVGILSVFSSIGIALVMNFLLGVTTLLSFISEYYKWILKIGRRIWIWIRLSWPVKKIEYHIEYCSERNVTILYGLVLRLRDF